MSEDQEARIKELEQKLDKKEDKREKLVTEDDWNWILIVFIALAVIVAIIAAG